MVKHIRQSMNDADSFEHVDTKYWEFKDHIVVSMRFRGTNAFGAKVLNAVKAKVSLDGSELEILETLP